MSATDVGIEGPDQTPPPARRHLRRGSTARAVLVVVLAVLLVLGLVALGYLVYRHAHMDDEPLNPFSTSASPVVSDTERHDASAVAEQFALRMDNVDGTHFDTYVKKVEQLLTTKAKADNAQVFSSMGKTYAAAKITGTGKVLLSGVADIDQDSATVLVAHDASVKTPQGTIEHHYRWNVQLAQVGGHWLVDSFTPVN